MILTNLPMCRFVHDGKLEIGEYIQLDDGTGLCYIPDLSNEGKTIFVSYSDGSMHEDICDLELIEVPFSVDCDVAFEPCNATPAEVKERIAKTNQFLDEYEGEVLDKYEADAALFNHLFGRDDGQ